jgi:hypothetical protein
MRIFEKVKENNAGIYLSLAFLLLLVGLLVLSGCAHNDVPKETLIPTPVAPQIHYEKCKLDSFDNLNADTDWATRLKSHRDLLLEQQQCINGLYGILDGLSK